MNKFRHVQEVFLSDGLVTHPECTHSHTRKDGWKDGQTDGWLDG